MPGTSVYYIPAGGQTAVIPLIPTMTLCAGPQVLGGTVLVETSPTPNGPWLAWPAGASGAAASIRTPVNAYARVTALTQAGVAVVSDVGGVNTPTFDHLVSANATIATPSSTAEQILFSLRIPPLYLPANFKLVATGSVSLTNNANVKTLTCRMNGITGTSFFTSPSLASNANYNFTASFVGKGGGTLQGVGAGATGGLGLSTTAFTSLAYDYINNELEVVFTATKATGTDTFALESLLIELFS